MRLGFSIATSVDADILIVDEVLAVGDLAFQRKCFDRMEDMIKRQGKTVMLVSHNTRQIERLCGRVILMDHGRVVADGPPGEVCDLFYERSDEKIKASVAAGTTTRWVNTMQTGAVQVLDIRIRDDAGEVTEAIEYRSDAAIHIRFVTTENIKRPLFLVGIHTTDFLYLSRNYSERQMTVDEIAPGTYEVVCRVKQFPLLPGVYAILFGIGTGASQAWLFYSENMVYFQVKNNAVSPLITGGSWRISVT